MHEPAHLDLLEGQSIYAIREARAKLKGLAVLWSMGKDSTVLLWLIRKAFFGTVPFPVLHIDTTKKIPEMIAHRDHLAREWNLDLIVGTNENALAEGMGPHRGRVACCNALKTEALQQLLEERGFRALFVGIRRDEEGTRSKERVFSPRGGDFQWDYKNQPPEFWDQFQTDLPPESHVRIHPLLPWRELDVWEYIGREKIPVMDLYFSRDGRRYRSVGCAPCTAPVASTAKTVAAIVAELRETRVSERSGRAQDKESEDAFERLRTTGYL